MCDLPIRIHRKRADDFRYHAVIFFGGGAREFESIASRGICAPDARCQPVFNAIKIQNRVRSGFVRRLFATLLFQ